MNYTRKSHTNYMLVLLIVLSSIIFSSCSKTSNNEPEPELEPGQSIGIVSIPNLRDMGGLRNCKWSNYCQRTGISFKSTLRH